MDVLTSETCWAVNNEIIKQVTSSWSLFSQLVSRALEVSFKTKQHTAINRHLGQIIITARSVHTGSLFLRFYKFKSALFVYLLICFCLVKWSEVKWSEVKVLLKLVRCTCGVTILETRYGTFFPIVLLFLCSLLLTVVCLLCIVLLSCLCLCYFMCIVLLCCVLLSYIL